MQQPTEAIQTATQFIADSVRAERHRRRKTQGQTAAIIDLTQDSYARRERGEVPFSGPELLVLAEAFGIPAAEFYPSSPTAPRSAVA